MNLHRKSAKHVKMNRTSFVSRNFFKSPQQIGETEMLSRVNFGRKCTFFHVKSSIAICYKILILNKKVWFLFLYKMQLILNTMLSLKLTKYFKVCYFNSLSTKVNMFYLSCVLFLIHRSELKYYH